MKFWMTLFLAFASTAMSRGDVFITEAHSTGSSSTTYAADWFELTNTGPAPVTITGWRMDDNSNSFAASVELTGITSIGAGESVIFIDGTATQATNFNAAWFGGSPPAGFQIGFYSGSGVGLSSGGDAVNVFDSSGNVLANVSFPIATLGVTFDNTAAVNGPISTLSSVGVNGAFNSVAGNEIGSPGIAVPEPSVVGMLSLIGVGVTLRRRKRS